MFLVSRAVVPGGKITYKHDFNQSDFFISKLSPAERVVNGTKNNNFVVGDPVYFSIKTPRTFSEAKINLRYKRVEIDNQSIVSDIPVIEAGLLVDGSMWRYDLKPIDNQILNLLSLGWPKIEEGGMLLFQRPGIGTSSPVYSSIRSFLELLPGSDEMAFYNFDFKQESVIDDYVAGKDVYELPFSLRGGYEFYTYIKDEDLGFEFLISDLNKNSDKDPVDIHLYYNDVLISSGHLDDDGIEIDSGKVVDSRETIIQVENLPEGIYKVEVRANDDIVTQKIITSQSKLSFINKFWIYDIDKKGLSFFTDSQEIRAQTTNPGNLQKIKAGEKDIDINKTYVQFMVNTRMATSTLSLEKGDVMLGGNRVFAPDESFYINPKIRKVDNNLNLADKKIKYILARYRLPENEGGWSSTTASFDLGDAYREDGKYGFIISVPGLFVEDDKYDGVVIDEISVEFIGTTLWKKIFN